MNHDEPDKLWELLGRGRKVEASPFFSRNILRTIREEEMQRPAGLAGWFRQHWQWLAVSSAAVLMAAGVIIADFIPGGVQEDATTIVAATPAPSKESEIDRLARAASESPEFAALIQNAEMLLASDVNDIWLSDSSAY